MTTLDTPPAPRFNLPGVYYPEPVAPKPPRTYRPGPKPGPRKDAGPVGPLAKLISPKQAAAIEDGLRANDPLKTIAHVTGVSWKLINLYVSRKGWRRMYLSREEQNDLRQRRVLAARPAA